MKTLFALLKKELIETFHSAIFYVAAFIFLLISGFSFWAHVADFNYAAVQVSRNPLLAGPLNLSDAVIKPFFLDTAVILLFIIPLISMRIYAEEKKSGTIELLFTYPISDLAALSGKFLASLLVPVIFLAGTLPPVLLLSRFGPLDGGVVFAGYAGLTLMAAAFLALGLFASALAENQIVAAVISFGALLLFLLIGWVKSLSGPLLGALLEHLAVAGHLESFINGLLDTRHIVYFLAFTFFWLFVTLRALNSRYWRG